MRDRLVSRQANRPLHRGHRVNDFDHAGTLYCTHPCHNREFPSMLLSILVLFFSSFSLSAANPSAVIDTLFADWNKSNSPGCVVGVVKDGEIVHQEGYGMANLEHDIPNTIRTAF